MKFSKKLLVLILAVMMLSGCAGKSDPVVDMGSMCSEILEKADFEDELTSVDEDVIHKLYDIQDYKEAELYISSGATAEEIAVFKFDSRDSAKEGLEKAESRIEKQKEDYENYVPKEVKKLDDALVKSYGTYVVVCVSNSDKAEKIVEEYMN